MAVVRVKNTQEGDAFVYDRYDDWANSRRSTYTPYEVNGKWRISVVDQEIDEEGNLTDPKEEVEPYDLSEDFDLRVTPTPTAEFASKSEAVKRIRKETHGGKTGPVAATRGEREYEAESMADIRRLSEED